MGDEACHSWKHRKVKMINLNFSIQKGVHPHPPLLALATVLFVTACRLLAICGGDHQLLRISLVQTGKLWHLEEGEKSRKKMYF